MFLQYFFLVIDDTDSKLSKVIKQVACFMHNQLMITDIFTTC